MTIYSVAIVRKWGVFGLLQFLWIFVVFLFFVAASLFAELLCFLKACGIHKSIGTVGGNIGTMVFGAPALWPD